MDDLPLTIGDQLTELSEAIRSHLEKTRDAEGETSAAETGPDSSGGDGAGPAS